MLIIILSGLLCYTGVFFGGFFGEIWSIILGALGLLSPSMYILEKLYDRKRQN